MFVGLNESSFPELRQMRFILMYMPYYFYSNDSDAYCFVVPLSDYDKRHANAFCSRSSFEMGLL